MQTILCLNSVIHIKIMLFYLVYLCFSAHDLRVCDFYIKTGFVDQDSKLSA